MKYLLDTNICIYAIKNKPKEVLECLFLHDPNDIFISSITYAELMYGVNKSKYPGRNRIALTLFLSSFEIVDFDASAAEQYGHIRSFLEREGKIIGAMDMMIASIARAKDMIVVTNNTSEFERVDGLHVENWAVKKY